MALADLRDVEYNPSMTTKTLDELIKAHDERVANGNWVPACNGTEVPFLTRTGRRLQYLWQPSSGRHAYIDCDTDIILSDAEAFAALGNV